MTEPDPDIIMTDASAIDSLTYVRWHMTLSEPSLYALAVDETMRVS